MLLRDQEPHLSLTRFRLALAASLFLLFLSASGHALGALAQESATKPDTPPNDKLQARSFPAPKIAQLKLNTKSAWKDLNPTQQQALMPLAEHWNKLEEERRRKWLVISRNFPSLSPAEQAKMHSRMAEWVTLSQQQRNQARQNYTQTQKLSPEEKARQWQAYQALSPEEKKKLATQAPVKPVGAAVVKSAPSPKLAKVPVTPLSPTPGSKLAAAKQSIQDNTLLPQPEIPQDDTKPEIERPNW
jgi:hypothetical protein